jgi:hypothetical protein
MSPVVMPNQTTTASKVLDLAVLMMEFEDMNVAGVSAKELPGLCDLCRGYCIVTVAEPVAQELPEEVDAVTVTLPAAKRFAEPPVDEGNVSFVVSLEVQVELAAWSMLLLSKA